jgi:radical SAM family uncharacterized protein
MSEYRIDPLKDIGSRLLDIEKPARYLGGEVGSIRKIGLDLFTVALCFPDLYEIGMSNNAIRILYDGLNRIEGLRCERVFAPAPDFETLLREIKIPLYTLESGIPLGDLDLLGFSVGYELAATSILAVLESGGIPLLAEERGEGDPIVIAGGPAISNPHPFADFLDAAYIGEAEGEFFALAADLTALSAKGARRLDLLDRISTSPAIWMPSRGGKPTKRAVRAIFSEFSSTVYRTAFPVATVKPVQDHGTVEIMRGCPNGCRFCHAGYYYRPQRSKPFPVIRAEVESLIQEGGYREITLASLSSGDYSGIREVLSVLNAEWSSKHVSFQLPSLKVNSFTLPLLKELSEVRKSGLTFAIETPEDAWQLMINKDVSFESTVAILEEAMAPGFRRAKFYFMIGLPVPGMGEGEADAIVHFFDRLFSRLTIQINVNVGTFIPKPHTPYQWCFQLGEDEALAAINRIRMGLRRHRNIKISYHSPFVSILEGVISRGDERVGALILKAFRRGARLDAWEERFDRELWRTVFQEADWDVIGESCRERDPERDLVWDDISVRVTKKFFLQEFKRSQHAITAKGCMEKCEERCGACSDSIGIVQNSIQPESSNKPIRVHAGSVVGRMVFRFSKDGKARYYQHLSIIDAFRRAFLMANVPMAFSEGFNPMPRFETGQPLAIAVASCSEIASLMMTAATPPDLFMERINMCLPDGLRMEEARYYQVVTGRRQYTIGSLSWGSDFCIDFLDSNERPEREYLSASIAKEIQRLNIDRAAVGSDDAGRIVVRLPESSRKETGLMRILEACTGLRPIQKKLLITRTKFYADIGQGPISFFEAYENRTLV